MTYPWIGLITLSAQALADANTPASRNQTVVSDSGDWPHVYLHAPYWPFERIGELTTAHNVDRAFMHMAYGQGRFTITRTDPILDNLPGALQRGCFVVIESSLAPRWIGFVRELKESLRSGLIEVDVMELMGILDVKATRQLAQFHAGSGHVFSQVMRALNSRGHSGIFFPSRVEPGPRVQIDLAAQTTFNSLKEMASRADYEFWLEAVADQAHIEATMYWGHEQGFDRSEDVILYEGQHFNELEYVLDTKGVRQSVTIFGGFASELAQRTAITRSAQYSPGSRELGVAVEPSSEAYSRFSDVPPALRSEEVLFRPMTSDRGEIAMEAQALERNVGVSERYRLIINNTVSWKSFGVGDYIRLIKGSTGIRALDRKARVMAMQPDEESGECVLGVETPIQ